MQTWIKFILWIVKLATWKELFFRILRRPPSQERNEPNPLAGLQPVNEHEPEAKAAAVDPSCSISRSLGARESTELEVVLSAISTYKRLAFEFSDSSFKLSTMSPHEYRSERHSQIFETNVSFHHDECMQIIRAVASSATMMEIELNFEKVEGCVEMLEQFHETIRSNQKFEIVVVDVRDVSVDWVVMTYGDLLLEGDKLRQFVCGGKGSQLSLSTVEKLATGFRRTKTLTNFVIYAKDPPGWIDTSGLKLLLDPFMDGEGCNKSVFGLGLNYAGIDDDGAEVVASMLRHNSSLPHLSVHGSKIGPKGTKYIADALRTNTTLWQLFLSDNPIGAEGLKALVESLTRHTSDGNLKPNSTLGILHIGGNIGKEGIEFLEALVQENDSLRALHMSDSSLLEDADNVVRLLQALKKNKCLTLVDLSNCGGVVGRKVLGTMLDLLQVNHHLKEIDLSGTALEADGGAELVSAQLEMNQKDKIGEVHGDGKTIIRQA